MAEEATKVRFRTIVIDDEPAVCELIQAVLASAGLDAVTETVSARAAETLKKDKFDAIFMDVRMPAPDGVTLARQVRAEGLNQKTPIIMVTGDEQRETLARGFEAGANFFLFKPIDKSRLLRVVRAARGPIQHERRRFQRVPVACAVKLESEGRTISGTTVDVSLNGILVDAGSVFAVGSRVDVKLELQPAGPSAAPTKPGSPGWKPAKPNKPLQATGRVMRAGPDSRMGILLESISPTESQRLQEFLLPLILKSSPE
jgi:CheY-like chemotaxis protein